MFRKITEYLTEWKSSPHRKPLILQGARQVGKTYSLLEFDREQYGINAIKLSTRNFGFEDGKKTVPLYAAFCASDFLKEKRSSI